MPVLALTTDSSGLTALGNDYGFEKVFERQVEAFAKRGDVVLGITTSGNSANVLKGLALAKKKGCRTLAFSGIDFGKGAKDGGKLARAPYVDLCLSVAGARGSHIQEAHIAMGHALCFIVESELKRRGKI